MAALLPETGDIPDRPLKFLAAHPVIEKRVLCVMTCKSLTKKKKKGMHANKLVMT
jgi:hypothetical protein